MVVRIVADAESARVFEKRSVQKVHVTTLPFCFLEELDSSERLDPLHVDDRGERPTALSQILKRQELSVAEQERKELNAFLRVRTWVRVLDPLLDLILLPFEKAARGCKEHLGEVRDREHRAVHGV